MADPVRMARTSVADYLAGERVAEVRHEYVDGELSAMGGANRSHGTLVMNLAIRLGTHIETGPCRIATSDMQVRAALGTRFYRPDIVVSRDDVAKEPDAYVATRPTLVVEVPSDTTEQIDRREKRLAYRSIVTPREHVFVAQDVREVSVYRRDGDDRLLEIFGPGQRATLSSLDFSIGVDDLYRGVG